MNQGLKISIIGFIILLGIVFIALVIVTRSQAVDIVNHPPEERPEIKETPEDYGMIYEKVSVTTEDGLKLYGWYIPGKNGATIMVEHGSPGGRQDGLYEAGFLNEGGYGVLLGSFRAHDECEGELISFGYHEQKDIAAWHQYLLGRDDVDPERIGLFGESMGGGTGILYIAGNPGISAGILGLGGSYLLLQQVLVKETQKGVLVFLRLEVFKINMACFSDPQQFLGFSGSRKELFAAVGTDLVILTAMDDQDRYRADVSNDCFCI